MPVLDKKFVPVMITHLRFEIIGTLAIFFGGIFFTLIKNKLKSKT